MQTFCQRSLLLAAGAALFLAVCGGPSASAADLGCPTTAGRPAAHVIHAALPLELIDLRFVEPGSPDLRLGPRLRAFFRNPGFGGLTRNFDVVVSAGLDNTFLEDGPQAIEQIGLLAPGEIRAIDVRLPVECLQMTHPDQAEPVPFGTIHVMLSRQANLLGGRTLQPLAVVAKAAIRDVDLSVIRPDNVQVPSGAVITLTGEGFGPAPGRAVLVIGGMTLAAEAAQWSPMSVQLKLPELPLAGLASGWLYIARADGQIAPGLPLILEPAAVAVVPAAPAVAGVTEVAAPSVAVPNVAVPGAPAGGSLPSGPLAGIAGPPGPPAAGGSPVAPGPAAPGPAAFNPAAPIGSPPPGAPAIGAPGEPPREGNIEIQPPPAPNVPDGAPGGAAGFSEIPAPTQDPTQGLTPTNPLGGPGGGVPQNPLPQLGQRLNGAALLQRPTP